ncbi:MAG: exonuclease SbcCD subunit D [Clostridia bacterium]|nr:exonuclease SbcCD subunit D [Clostridia bacterium]
MKFLHTSDWHLGAKTNGKDRLDEQKRVLDEILSIANYENIDCVIVAGDVFNTANPSADAEELFFETIEKFSNGGDRFVFVLAGNHDDPTRLAAGLPLAEKHNIALVSDLNKLNEARFKKNGVVSVVETGKGYLKLKKNEEIVTIAYLPYPSESRITEKVFDDSEELSYAEKVARWAEIGAGGFDEKGFNVFVSHLFLVGSKTGTGTVRVGDILAVPSNMLPKASYTALGHIHRHQEVAKNMFYSGAITKLAVSDKELSVIAFESENGVLASLEKIPLQTPQKYERVVVSSIEEARQKLSEFDDGDIVELVIKTEVPLSALELKQLKKDFACISTVGIIHGDFDVQETDKKKRKLMSDAELFKEFYKKVRGIEPTDDLIQMFVSLKGGEDETN